MKKLDFVLNAFLRCRLEAVAALPFEHPDIEAARLATLTEVRLSGMLRVNDWTEAQEEEQDEEEPEPEPEREPYENR